MIIIIIIIIIIILWSSQYSNMPVLMRIFIALRYVINLLTEFCYVLKVVRCYALLAQLRVLRSVKRQLGNYPQGLEKYRLGIRVEKVFKLLAKCPEEEK